ncbi:hypothetical protein ES702_04500 [subsurface metagenome]
MRKGWLIPLFLAGLVLIDHRIKNGCFFDARDFVHHESLVIALVVLSLGKMI